MSNCYLVQSNNKHHFVTKRFDIVDGEKFHVHSLAGLLHVDYNIPRSLGYEDLFRVAVKLNAVDSIHQLFLQMLFNYMFVNQDDHPRNFSFMCGDDYKWRATPAYDITFAKGVKQTKEHQLTLNSKVLSQINLQDVVNIATEFSISLESISNAIQIMQKLRDTKLPSLMKEYKISKDKQAKVLKEVNKRDFQGELNG
jgi:serine/threonine-protein kinase HipA